MSFRFSDQKNVWPFLPIYNQTVDIPIKLWLKPHITHTGSTREMPVRVEANENVVNITSTNFTSNRLAYSRINHKVGK